MISPSTHATMNTSAIPRAGPTPNHDPISCTQAPVVMNGMNTSCAIGPIRNAVIGEAANSTLCANPNTLPCLSNGTTFWMTVLSDASMNGMNASHTKIPAARSHTDGCITNQIHVDHDMRFILNMVFNGFFPSPNLDIITPQSMNAKLSTHRINPHFCTETSESPYASIRAMNTHPRKLLNVVKKMSANIPGIWFMILIVPFTSIFFGLSA